MSSSLGFADCPGGVAKTDMAEGLREATEQLAGLRLRLLGDQTKIVREAGDPLTHISASISLIGERQRFCEPERAEQEGALFAGSPSTPSSVR
jgi:hypothetical protein